MNLAEAVARALDEEERPQWLREMPSADAPKCRLLRELGSAGGSLLEIGTACATGAAHFASLGGRVRTIDPMFTCRSWVERLRARGWDVEWFEGSSHSPEARAWAEGFSRYDVLYIDGEHTEEGASQDYAYYAQLVCAGGLVLFDDIELNDGMRQFWKAVPDPKMELLGLSTYGLGAKEMS